MKNNKYGFYLKAENKTRVIFDVNKDDLVYRLNKNEINPTFEELLKKVNQFFSETAQDVN